MRALRDYGGIAHPSPADDGGETETFSAWLAKHGQGSDEETGRRQTR